jgi:hypothetical protein
MINIVMNTKEIILQCQFCSQPHGRIYEPRTTKGPLWNDLDMKDFRRSETQVYMAIKNFSDFLDNRDFKF